MESGPRDYIPQSVRRIFEGHGNTPGSSKMTQQELQKRMTVYRRAFSQLEDHVEWYWSEDNDQNKVEIERIIEGAIEALMRIKA